MKILMVLTSHEQLGDTDKKTGFWVEEFAAPYYVFADAGYDITLASPKGGQPPIDPSSTTEDSQTESTRRFDSDEELKNKLAHTKKLEHVESSEYDAVFYPGGHGPLWDLTNDLKSISLIEEFYAEKKPMAFVCHAPGVLKNAMDHERPIVRGKNVTGFTNTEEEAVGLTEVVPFLVQDVLNQLGANYSKAEDWAEYVMVDHHLITGQNPASSKKAAEVLVEKLEE